MDNFLENGSVLPSGLLSNNIKTLMGGFNKSYNNTYLRIGVIINSYDISDPNNRSKLTTEYDVSVIEQNQDIGVTSIVYKNCMSSDGLGSVADFFEKTFRKMEQKTTKGSGINLKGQNGAVVLLLCLDGMSEKGIIIGGFPHPDRNTTLTSEGPSLQTEFNGVNLKINQDGSTGITVKGPTDNNGNIKSPINTNINVESNGSVQITNNSVTFRLDSSGAVTITAQGAININAQGNTEINSQGNLDIKCSKANVVSSGDAIVEGSSIKLGQGASESLIKGDLFAKLFATHTHTSGIPGSPTSPPTQSINSALSKKVKTE